jgi:hypothetical protein
MASTTAQHPGCPVSARCREGGAALAMHVPEEEQRLATTITASRREPRHAAGSRLYRSRRSRSRFARRRRRPLGSACVIASTRMRKRRETNPRLAVRLSLGAFASSKARQASGALKSLALVFSGRPTENGGTQRTG